MSRDRSLVVRKFFFLNRNPDWARSVDLSRTSPSSRRCHLIVSSWFLAIYTCNNFPNRQGGLADSRRLQRYIRECLQACISVNIGRCETKNLWKSSWSLGEYLRHDSEKKMVETSNLQLSLLACVFAWLNRVIIQ